MNRLTNIRVDDVAPSISRGVNIVTLLVSPFVNCRLFPPQFDLLRNCPSFSRCIFRLTRYMHSQPHPPHGHRLWTLGFTFTSAIFRLILGLCWRSFCMWRGLSRATPLQLQFLIAASACIVHNFLWSAARPTTRPPYCLTACLSVRLYACLPACLFNCSSVCLLVLLYVRFLYLHHLFLVLPLAKLVS